MIERIKITNHLGNELMLDLRYPWDTGVAVRSIKGIGPQKADINTSEVSTNDGSIFNSARLTQRNIVFELSYLHTPTRSVEDVRHMVYTYFPVKKRITMEFHTTVNNGTNERVSRISGYVESNENQIFTNKEFTQISIICPDPRFYDAGESGTISMSFSSVTPTFSFEEVDGRYVIPNDWDLPMVDEYDAIEFGMVNTDQNAEIDYRGDDEIGVTVTFQATGPVTNPRIILENKNQLIKVNTEMEPLDLITITTVKGHKSVTRIRGGVVTNLLNYLDRTSKWFVLDYGINRFTYAADAGASNLLVAVTYDTVYEGI